MTTSLSGAVRLLTLCLPLTAASLEPAAAERSGWSAAERSQLRLLLVPGGDGSTLAGGIEIALEPDWYTYWRNPGEAGVPPRFDFSRSENVASVEVLYPAPERYDDGVSTSLIYRDEVVFPVVVTPADKDREVTVRVDASFGVCREICIPTQAAADATLGPSAPADPLATARLRRFQPQVPKGPQPGRFDVEAVTVAGDDLLIDVRVPSGGAADLFAEPPEGWYVGQPQLVAEEDGLRRFRLPLQDAPAAVAGQTFRFVAVSGGEAIEESVTIR